MVDQRSKGYAPDGAIRAPDYSQNAMLACILLMFAPQVVVLYAVALLQQQLKLL